jgi:hypothetical protein
MRLRLEQILEIRLRLAGADVEDEAEARVDVGDEAEAGPDVGDKINQNRKWIFIIVRPFAISLRLEQMLEMRPGDTVMFELRLRLEKSWS